MLRSISVRDRLGKLNSESTVADGRTSCLEGSDTPSCRRRFRLLVLGLVKRRLAGGVALECLHLFAGENGAVSSYAAFRLTCSVSEPPALTPPTACVASAYALLGALSLKSSMASSSKLSG